MSEGWQSLYSEAEALLKGTNHFDGVQKINQCMELFETEGGGSGSRILKEPNEFLAETMPKLSAEQKVALRKMYEVRGDLLCGLGALKRAATEYGCAATLDPDSEELKAKRAKVESAGTAAMSADADKKVPVSVLTGFLGSGKTTLLNHILQANHGKRIAVIENEFGEVGIDDSLVKAGSLASEENIVEMNNGCICCTVRGDLIAGLKKLIKNSQKSGKILDGVLIETTGLADPAPVAQTFFADDYVQQHMRLDGILTLVDAAHIIQHLDDEKPEGVENEAVEQIAFADRILLNKCDLVEGEEQLAEVETRIRAINKTVPIKRTTNSEVEMDFILGIRGFSLDKIIEMDDAFLEHSHDHQLTTNDSCCSICLADFEPLETVKVTPCKHGIHQHCLERWLTQQVMQRRAPSCVVCRQALERPAGGKWAARRMPEVYLVNSAIPPAIFWEAINFFGVLWERCVPLSLATARF